MGDVVNQDRVYTIEVLLELLANYEKEWINAKFNIDLHIISACMFLLVSGLVGMRGFGVG